MLALVSRRYERGSIIVTSNRSSEHRARSSGDAMVAGADRPARPPTTMVTLKAKSYRHRNGAPGPEPQAPSLRA
jgi:IstB-like ATP binding protein